MSSSTSLTRIDAIVVRFRKEIGENTRVIARGSLAQRIHKVSRTIELVDQWVTLEWLHLLFERQN